MPIFCTQMQVFDQVNKEFVWIEGQRIEAPTFKIAEAIIKNKGLRWLVITGELICEIPCKDDGVTPDWDNKIDYQKIQQN